ncbi:MAG: hypothetical protein ABSH33_13390 [Steroidobacteraceae bacterium]|jgi:hypothetical protein
MEQQLNDAVGSFFVEFSKFETHSIGLALRSLSKDAVFVEHAEILLDLEARLKLLERMAFARDVPPGLIAELEACLLRARKLREQRDEVARNLMTAELGKPAPLPGAAGKPRSARRRSADYSRLAELENLWVPAIARVQEYVDEAKDLQETLRVLTHKLERHAPALAAESA